MKTISKDPNIVIPDISESYIKNKLLVVHITDHDGCEYIGIVHRGNSLMNEPCELLNKFFIRGAFTIGRGTSIWTPIQETAIRLLCHVWELYVNECEYEVEVHIIENSEECNQIIDTLQIKNTGIITIMKNFFSPDTT